jgi:hypothetical protein
MILHGPLTERRVQNSSIVACIRCRANVFTESLTSNDGDIHIHTQGELISLLLAFQNKELTY